jgi:hypothetical protein
VRRRMADLKPTWVAGAVRAEVVAADPGCPARGAEGQAAGA